MNMSEEGLFIHENASPHIVWVIAGNDSGGGAGLSADQRAMAAFGVHACPVVATVTAQNSVAVTRVEAVSAELLDAQLATLAADMPPAAIKTGLLGNADQVAVVARWVDRLRQHHPGLPLVVDPVLRASTGRDLATDPLCRALRDLLLPRATLITPNRAEAARLLGLAAELSAALPATQVPELAQGLQQLGQPGNATSVVVTGGDAATAHGDPHRPPCCDDWLASPHASGWLSLPRVATPHHHGTGCTFASAAAAALALGFVPADAVVLAKMATAEGLRHAHAAGAGAGPLKPQPGFAQRLANLPTFSLPGALHPATPLQPAPPVLAGAQRQLGLYPVVDSADWVERVLAAGVRTVQLRIKHPQPSGLRSDPQSDQHSDLRQQVRRSVQAARAVGAQLYINDHWQLAIEEGAFGVHLGQEDLGTADVRAIANAGLHLGLSTHSLWEVCRAWALQPSYIACGPIHATTSKDMPWLPQGNGNLAFWRHLLPMPVVAIAGMDAPRLREAVRHGAAGVALITAITQAADPVQAMAALQQAFAQGLQDRADHPAPVPRLPRSTLASGYSSAPFGVSPCSEPC